MYSISFITFKVPLKSMILSLKTHLWWVTKITYFNVFSLKKNNSLLSFSLRPEMRHNLFFFLLKFPSLKGMFFSWSLISLFHTHTHTHSGKCFVLLKRVLCNCSLSQPRVFYFYFCSNVASPYSQMVVKPAQMYLWISKKMTTSLSSNSSGLRMLFPHTQII